MNTTKLYLEEVKRKLTLTSDYQLAKALETSVQNVSRWMNEQQQLDVYGCFRVAEILGIDARKVVAGVELEREKNEKKQAYWENFLKRHCKTIVGAVLSIGLVFGMSSGLIDPTMSAAAVAASVMWLLDIIYAIRQ